MAASRPTGEPTEHHGLVVWASKSGEGWWSPEYADLPEPEGWTLLRKGDAVLTRMLTKGPHWVVMVKQGKALNYANVRVGILAPAALIESARAAAGGEAGAQQRIARQRTADEARDKRYDEQFAAEVRHQYPSIPKSELPKVVSQARSEGRVGRSSRLYFSKSQERAQALAELAHLAVRAHVRHQHTSYDEDLMKAQAARMGTKLDDDEYRSIKGYANAVAESTLDKWRKPPRKRRRKAREE